MLRKTAFDLLQSELKENAVVKTSCTLFNKALSGGIKSKTITEITGLPGKNTENIVKVKFY